MEHPRIERKNSSAFNDIFPRSMSKINSILTQKKGVPFFRAKLLFHGHPWACPWSVRCHWKKYYENSLVSPKKSTLLTASFRPQKAHCWMFSWLEIFSLQDLIFSSWTTNKMLYLKTFLSLAREMIFFLLFHENDRISRN